MIQWKDKTGRAWSCRLTVDDARRLKDAGFDIADPTSFQRVFASAIDCVELMAEAMRPQWEKEGLSYLQFSDVLLDDAATFAEAQGCFVAGIADFFRRLGENAMATIVEKAMAAAKTSKAAMEQRANSQAVDSFIQRALAKDEKDFLTRLAKEEAKLFGQTSTNAPASSESIQGLGPIEALQEQPKPA